ncbi:MAG: tetratricopeptide repeat protein, partial [Acidobacteriota bacterium]|nr:tetratricopeptide repeat protein [Acidobacteriota bacterium]
MSACTLVWLLLFQPVDVAGVALDPTEAFVRGNTAYESGDYAAAAEAYLRLVEAVDDAGWAVYYNLGNSQLRRGDLGAGIASYLRARRRAPRNQDVVANLAYARRSAKDAISPPEPSAIVRTAFFWHYAFAPDELA